MKSSTGPVWLYIFLTVSHGVKFVGWHQIAPISIISSVFIEYGDILGFQIVVQCYYISFSMKSSFPLPKGGEGLMLSFDTLNSSALRFLLNQRLRALFLVDIVGPPKFWYRTVLLWLEVCSGFLNTRNWDPQLPLPGCSLKMTCRRLFVPERVVQHWHPLVWEAEKVSKVSSFWKDWARSWEDSPAGI